MKLRCLRSVYFEHIVLASIIDEIVRAVRQPAIQDWLEAMVVVRHANYELLFNPSQLSAIREPGRGKCLNEVNEQRATGNSRV